LAKLVEYAHRRHQVERFHQDAKTLLGWDQYQGRRWDGFHRHAVRVMLAYSFLVWSEWQQRAHRGKPGRRAFSPRPDQRRQSLAAVHRYLLDWLRLLAIDQLIREGRLDDYRPDKEVTE
jgi:hypothetical protein